MRPWCIYDVLALVRAIYDPFVGLYGRIGQTTIQPENASKVQVLTVKKIAKILKIYPSSNVNLLNYSTTLGYSGTKNPTLTDDFYVFVRTDDYDNAKKIVDRVSGEISFGQQQNQIQLWEFGSTKYDIKFTYAYISDVVETITAKDEGVSVIRDQPPRGEDKLKKDYNNALNRGVFVLSDKLDIDNIDNSKKLREQNRTLPVSSRLALDARTTTETYIMNMKKSLILLLYNLIYCGGGNYIKPSERLTNIKYDIDLDQSRKDYKIEIYP